MGQAAVCLGQGCSILLLNAVGLRNKMGTVFPTLFLMRKSQSLTIGQV